MTTQFHLMYENMGSIFMYHDSIFITVVIAITPYMGFCIYNNNFWFFSSASLRANVAPDTPAPTTRFIYSIFSFPLLQYFLNTLISALSLSHSSCKRSGYSNAYRNLPRQFISSNTGETCSPLTLL